MVLCVDEKSQIQALDRTQPGLPLKKGRCGTRNHDYVRRGTTTLFAALEVLEGKVIDQCLPRHRHQEFLKFLRTLDASYPKSLDLHLILDNYGTHKHARALNDMTHIHFPDIRVLHGRLQLRGNNDRDAFMEPVSDPNPIPETLVRGVRVEYEANFGIAHQVLITFC